MPDSGTAGLTSVVREVLENKTRLVNKVAFFYEICTIKII